MKLPNAPVAVVEPGKIRDYLLNPAHPDNGGKAEYFLAAGFSKDEWQIFADALLELVETAEVAKKVESRHGIKYVVDGKLKTPEGKLCELRTIWIIDKGEQTTRLVTAYPTKKAR
jgi:hypothetical protein